MLPRLRNIGYIVHLGIVGHKPVHDTERDFGLAVDNVHHFMEIVAVLVEFEEVF
jgi:hypothetical protein